MYRVAILTVSDRCSRNERVDTSGPVIKKIIEKIKAEVVFYEVIPDEAKVIKQYIRRLCDQEKLDLILTTGGTGVSPRDVTPDVTLTLLDREISGMAEAMRAASLKKTRYAMISRAVCGIRKSTLIINLPGSPKGAEENLKTIIPTISHSIDKIKGDQSECGKPRK